MTSRISRNPQIMGGAYCIRGQRIPVWVIKQCARDWSHATILREYPTLTQEDIDAALRFRAPRKRDEAAMAEARATWFVELRPDYRLPPLFGCPL